MPALSWVMPGVAENVGVLRHVAELSGRSSRECRSTNQSSKTRQSDV